METHNETGTSEHDEEDLSEEEVEKRLAIVFSIFVFILLGAGVRFVIKKYKITLPYTVVLMLCGLIIGAFSKYLFGGLKKYTMIARIHPKAILFIFLPPIIFESAFSIPTHTFLKSLTQILLVAIPGMIFATFITALVCYFPMAKYNWSYLQWCLFGAIVSATDPVAVVAILKELGASESLSVLIEGESLFNDGIAILLFEIFKELLMSDKTFSSSMFLEIIGKFAQLALGGPFFGFLGAKSVIFALNRIYNDATIEISLTIVSAYLTFYIGEEILGVSGILAVVTLGITMNASRTCISPDSQHALHHFWEMVGYLANTVLFVIVGIVSTEMGLSDFVEWADAGYLILIYVFINIIRLSMFVMLRPILKRLGYGLPWENIAVMTWGGLRGAVGLCLALEVFENVILTHSHPTFGPKVLFHIAGIVFLTLVINATTTRSIMNALEMTKMSESALEQMDTTIQRIKAARAKLISSLKHDRFLADADWAQVEELTSISNPLEKERHQVNILPKAINVRKISNMLASGKKISIANEYVPDNNNSKEKAVIKIFPDYLSLTSKKLPTIRKTKEEIRIRILKTLKICFWRQHELGITKGMAVEILCEACDRKEDEAGSIIRSSQFKKYWNINSRLSSFVYNNHDHEAEQDHKLSDSKRSKLQNFCLRICKSHFFPILVTVILVLNLIESFWTIDLEFSHMKSSNTSFCFFDNPSTKKKYVTLRVINAGFTIFYLIELLLQVIAYGVHAYFITEKWHTIELIVLLCCIVDAAMDLLPCNQKDLLASQLLSLVKVIRLFRIVRLVKLAIIPLAKRVLDIRLNEKLFLGFDIAKGLINGIEETLKLLPYIASDPKILNEFRNTLDKERLSTIKELATLQKSYPQIAMAVKTRNASRTVFNQMKATLSELKSDGLIDEKNSSLVQLSIEEGVKSLWKVPEAIELASEPVKLDNISWLRMDEKVLNHVKENATLVEFSVGDSLFNAGESAECIFVIVTGLLRGVFSPEISITQDLETYGILPNSDLLTDPTFSGRQEDIFLPGTIIGEAGVIKHLPWAYTAVCETPVTAYQIDYHDLLMSMQFDWSVYDSMVSLAWKNWAVRVGAMLLRSDPNFQNWSSDRIHAYLESSCVPQSISYLEIPDYISDVMVVEGLVQNYHTQQIFVAPCVLPKTCTHIFARKNPKTQNKLLLVAHDDIDEKTLEELSLKLASTMPEQSLVMSPVVNNILGYLDTYKIQMDPIPSILRKKSITEPTGRMNLRQRRISIAVAKNRKESLSKEKRDTSGYSNRSNGSAKIPKN